MCRRDGNSFARCIEMGGRATAIGEDFQARVAACVLAYMLAERPVQWIPSAVDLPLAITAETGGPGDDLRVTISGHSDGLEIQAKHGLKGEKRVGELLEELASRATAGAEPEVLIAVDGSASAWIADELAPDLQSRRTGRSDALRSKTKRLLARVPALSLRCGVRRFHLDDHDDSDRQAAMAWAAARLVDPAQVDLVWDVFRSKGIEIASGRTGLTRADLLDALTRRGVHVRRPHREQFVSERLDEIKGLLDGGELDAARALIVGIGKEMARVPYDLRVRHASNRGVLAHRLGDYDEAEAAWREALSVQPTYIPALCNLAALLSHRGDAQGAVDLAERALKVDPDNVSAWSARRVALDAIPGIQIAPHPSGAIEGSSEYQSALAQVALAHREWPAARDHSLRALQSRESVETLYVRASVLATLPIDLVADELAALDEAELLLSRALPLVPNVADTRREQLLLRRADVRRRLGRDVDAADDLSAAGHSGEFEPNRVRLEALRLMEDDRFAEAGAVLRQKEVEEVPLLLAMRADISRIVGDHERAKADVDRAYRLLNSQETSVGERASVASAALRLGDTALAAEILSPLSESTEPRALSTRALFELEAGSEEVGLELLRNAIGQVGASEARQFGMMAVEALLQRKSWNLIVSWIHERQLEDDEAAVVRLAQALMELRLYRELDALLSRAPKEEQIPRWVSAARLELARRREDPVAALAAIRDLQSRGENTMVLIVDELRYLLIAGELTVAETRFQTLRDRAEELDARRLAIAAEVAAKLGHDEVAAEFAFLAYRRSPLDLLVVQSLIRRIIPTGRPAADPVVLAANTSATLVEAVTGAERSVVILDRSDVDPLRDEVHISDRLATALLGKRAGDEITLGAESAFPHNYRIKEVLPAWVPALRDAMLHSEERFPEQSPVRSIPIGSEVSIAAIARIAQVTSDRAKFIDSLMEGYGRGELPLSLVAEASGIGLPELFDELTDPRSKRPEYTVEGIGSEYLDAIAAVRDCTALVLTLDALVGADALGLLSVLENSKLNLFAPYSLRGHLISLRDEAAVNAQEGSDILSTDDAGALRMINFGPEYFLPRHSRYERLLLWVNAHIELRGRPLAALEREGELEIKLRTAVGETPTDAIEIASESGAVLYTDDLRMRRAALGEGRCRGCSSITLAEALADRGLIQAEQRYRTRLTLIERRWVAVPVDAVTIHAAIQARHTLGETIVRSALARCAVPHVSLDTAATIVAQASRLLALESVQGMTAVDLTMRAVQVFSSRWPRRNIVSALGAQLDRTLALLPILRAEIQAAFDVGPIVS